MFQRLVQGYYWWVILTYPPLTGKNQITSLSNQSFEHHFLQKLQDTYLCQHVQEPTRFRDDSNPSVLDLVITKSPDDVRNIEILPPLGKSDHTVLKLSLKSSGDDPTPQKQTLKYNYTKGDYESFRNFILSLCIMEQLRENKYNVNEVFELVHEALVVGQNKFIPTIAYSRLYKNRQTLPRETLQAISEKNYWWL